MNEHKGETCTIIGNGPSLNDVPNAFLDRYPTFGTNGIFRRYDPTYYVYIDPDVEKLKLYLDRVNALDSVKYADKNIVDLIPGSIPLNVEHTAGFSFTPLDKIYGYFSSATAMFQLAYWMGFTTVFLVGFDHRYATPAGARAWHWGRLDVNHFTPDYYPPGTRWKAPDLYKLAGWMRLAKRIFEKDGRTVINLTKGSGLDVFVFGSISD